VQVMNFLNFCDALEVKDGDTAYDRMGPESYAPCMGCLLKEHLFANTSLSFVYILHPKTLNFSYRIVYKNLTIELADGNNHAM
jgi:hypothetical protein